jgi:hypothetical protein
MLIINRLCKLCLGWDGIGAVFIGFFIGKVSSLGNSLRCKSGSVWRLYGCDFGNNIRNPTDKAHMENNQARK